MESNADGHLLLNAFVTLVYLNISWSLLLPLSCYWATNATSRLLHEAAQRLRAGDWRGGAGDFINRRNVWPRTRQHILTPKWVNRLIAGDSHNNDIYQMLESTSNRTWLMLVDLCTETSWCLINSVWSCQLSLVSSNGTNCQCLKLFCECILFLTFLDLTSHFDA